MCWRKEDWKHHQWRGSRDLNRVARGGLIEKVTFEKRLEEGERASHVMTGVRVIQAVGNECRSLG